MQRLTFSPSPAAADQPPVLVAEPAPLLIGIRELSRILSRSVASLHRDDAAGRLPGALWIGSSKRWRLSEITAWTEAGCPSRREWELLRDSSAQRNGRR